MSGSNSDDEKEELLTAFAAGQIKNLITKPQIGGFGLNWQHCAHMTFFPSHSYEQYYQGVRRCWRFGQLSPVNVDIVSTEGETGVLRNIKRKSAQADKMFSELIAHMNNAMSLRDLRSFEMSMEKPEWL